MNGDFVVTTDQMARIEAVARRLFTEQRMSGDAMRNAAQMLTAILDAVPAYERTGAHATYDARIA